MTVAGNIKKMVAELGDPIQYYLPIGEERLHMNPLIGQSIKITFDGTINCKRCGKKTKKSFNQGFCYPCFVNAPESAPCIIKPELCMAHQGEGRDVEWEEANHNQPHVVYLALTSGVKVGVTRATQVPTRWIDQGAWKVIKLAEVPYRYLAGAIEVQLKDYLTDKTHWQKMLKNVLAEEVDLKAVKQAQKAHLSADFQSYFSTDDDIVEMKYPVIEYPLKVKSLGLDKLPEIEAKLMGIKGQYLLFDEGRVMNMRKHAGYLISLSLLS